MTSPVEIQVVTFPRTMRILGRDIEERDSGSPGVRNWSTPMFAEPSVSLFCHSGGSWSLGAQVDSQQSDGLARRTASHHVWDFANPSDAEVAWLESASLETPRLAAMIVDGMGGGVIIAPFIPASIDVYAPPEMEDADV